MTTCPVTTVFDRINSNENILYKLFNSGKTLQGISGTQTYVIEIIRGSTKPVLFWKIVQSIDNNGYYFYNSSNVYTLICRPELGGICEDDVTPQPEGRFRFYPSSNAIERAKGLCNIQSTGRGWLSVDSSTNVVKVTSNQSDPSAVWMIVPYSLNKVPLF